MRYNPKDVLLNLDDVRVGADEMGHQDTPQPLPLSAAEPAAAVGVGEEISVTVQNPVELLH